MSQEAKEGGLDKSLFERLLNSRTVTTETGGFIQLDVQRRMHSSIAHFPCTHFYRGEVRDGIRNRDLPPIPGIGWPEKGECRLLFVDCDDSNAEEAVGTSVQNKLEARALVDTLSHIFKQGSGLKFEDVAVIAVYSAQRALLQARLKKEFHSSVLSRLRVDTVDGFQGMERALVLVTMTRANFSGDIGFLRDRRRANVLLTRAQRGLIIFGHGDTLRRERAVWSPWLDWMDRRHAIVHVQDLKKVLIW